MKKIFVFILLSFLLVGCNKGPKGSAPIFYPAYTMSITLQQYTAMPEWSELVSVTDVEDGIITDYQIDDSNVNMQEEGRYQVIFTATDLDKNVSKFILNVDVLKVKMAKVIGATDIEVEVGSPEPDWLEGVYAYDGLLTLIPLSINNVDKRDLDLNKVGSYMVLYTIETDYKQTLYLGRNVKVIDIKVPEFKGLKDHILEVGSPEPDWLKDISVIDSMGDEYDLTYENVNFSQVKRDQIGTYDVIYSFTDGQGRHNEAIIKVHIIHNEKPIIEGLINLTIDVNSENINWLEGLKGKDSLGNSIDLTLKNVDLSNVKIDTVGEYEVIYHVTDMFGLTNFFKITVNVVSSN